MYNRLLLTVLFFTASMTLSFSQPMPDIKEYGRQIFEIVKNKDEAKFNSKMLHQEKEFSNFLLDALMKDSILSREVKRELGDNPEKIKEEITNEVQKRINKQKKAFQKATQGEVYQKFNFSKAIYMDTYFTIRREPRESFITGAELKIKYKVDQQYFLLLVRDVVFMNGKWTGGLLKDIDEVDVTNREIQDEYAPTADSVAADTAAAAPIQENLYTLEGTIGNSPIVLSMNEYDTQLVGNYFYKKYNKEIIFIGTKNGNEYVLTVAQGNGEKFTLLRNGDKWTGTWESGDKKLNVILKASK